MPTHAARHPGPTRHGGVPHTGAAGRHVVASRHRGVDLVPPPPPGDPAELVGIPRGRVAYRLHTLPEGRHRSRGRYARSRAVLGGVAGMTVTAVTVKIGAAAAVSSLALSIQNLIR